MIPPIADPVKLRRKAFEALVDKLGWMNAVRFIGQMEQGVGDYTKERADMLPDWDADTLVRKASEMASNQRSGAHGERGT